MRLGKFLKPTILKIMVFLFIGIIYLYLAAESVCGAGFGFTICYKAYGFPFQYFATGDVDSSMNIIESSLLGQYFNKIGNFLFNPISLALDLTLIYLLSCLISMIFKNKAPGKNPEN